MDYERDRLRVAGHNGPEPLWIAIEDETTGYDIRSCQLTAGTMTPLYIEVKASDQRPFVFFLSDNEWRFAQNNQSSFVFHFWYLPNKELRVVSANEIVPHIPINQADGVWKKVQIPWTF